MVWQNLYYELYHDAELGKKTIFIPSASIGESILSTQRNGLRRLEVTWESEPGCKSTKESSWEQVKPLLTEVPFKKVKVQTSEDFYKKHYNMMRVWEEPQPYHTYLIAADSSFGRDRDYSAFHVINLYNGTQVAEFYSNRIGLNDFAKVIAEEGLRYNMAYVCP